MKYIAKLFQQVHPAAVLAVACAVLTVSLSAQPARTYAFDIWPSGSCGAASSSAVCASKGNTNDPVSGQNGVILRVADILALVAGLAAVIVIILAGWNYINSGGDAAKTKTAKDAIIFALIGLVVIVLAHSILGFVLSKVG